MKKRLLFAAFCAGMLSGAVLTGCGGSGNSTSNTTIPTATATPTPNASPTPASGIVPTTATRFTNAQGVAGVRVAWSLGADVTPSNVVEYHVFRDGQIVGVATPLQNTFDDLVMGDFTNLTANSVVYPGNSNINIAGTLVATSFIVPVFLPSVAHEYWVTVIFRQDSSYRQTTLGSVVRVP